MAKGQGRAPLRLGPAGRVAAAIVVALMLLAAATVGNGLLYAHLIDQRDRVWCPALELLTSGKPRPGATARDRKALADLRAVRSRFGC